VTVLGRRRRRSKIATDKRLASSRLFRTAMLRGKWKKTGARCRSSLWRPAKEVLTSGLGSREQPSRLELVQAFSKASLIGLDTSSVAPMVG
jgi:hypothetical protein